MSNRRSALRKRVQEQAEIETLEEQIRFLAQANCRLKSEEMRLEHLLQHAQNCIRGKRHFHKAALPENKSQEDCKPSSLTTSNPLIKLHGMDDTTPAVSQFLRPPFQATCTAGDSQACAAPVSISAATSHDFSQWGRLGKREGLGGQHQFDSASSAGPSGSEMFAALSQVIDLSERNMYGLVTPMATSGGESFTKQDQTGGLDAVWNSLLAKAAQDEGFLQTLHSAAGMLSTTSDGQNRDLSTNQNNPSLIVSQQPNNNILPLGYSNSKIQGGLQIRRNEQTHDVHILAHGDESSSNSHEYNFEFDQKMERFTGQPQLECALSDQSSSCSADLDRFLALGEQLD
jgi:hypothetical protein